MIVIVVFWFCFVYGGWVLMDEEIVCIVDEVVWMIVVCYLVEG